MKRLTLYYLLVSWFFLLNSCQKEHSFENGTGPSAGSLQDDGAGECLPKTVAGAYVVGTVLDPNTHYIEVQVDVTTAGAYTIYSDTLNGYHFRATGIFSTTGLQIVRLKGKGTPVAAGTDDFVIFYNTSGCAVSVDVSGSLAVFSLDGAPNGCTSAAPAGTYTVGVDLTSANNVNISINVTTPGSYNIITAAANGMVFTGSGVLTTPGATSIVLTGSGKPTTAGVTNIPVTAGSSSCSFPVTVAAAPSAAVYTIDCPAAAVNGTYTVNTDLVGTTNTIGLTVNVATAGAYTITGTVNGMTFSHTGTFATTGNQTVTLAGSGKPTTAGANVVNLTGATAPCAVTVNVNPAAGGAAVFTLNCPGAAVNGTYTVGVALVGATNTIVLNAIVTTPGTYNITGTLNNMTFSASGSFPATGTFPVTLAGSGTPNTAGANAVPLTGGASPCNVSVNVNPAGGGAATFTVDCSSAELNGYLTKGVAVAAVNTIEIEVNVTVLGTFNITIPTTNGFSYSKSGTFTTLGIQTVVLNGTGTPTNSGTFTLTVNGGTAPCTFDILVDPNYGTWKFTVGTTTYEGTVYDAGFDTSTGLLIYGTFGDNAPGDLFELYLIDISGAIAANETYSCAPSPTGNAGAVYYEGVNGTTFDADLNTPGNTIIITVTSHNTTTKTIAGTFTGTIIKDGTTPVALTGGQFSVTYP